MSFNIDEWEPTTKIGTQVKEGTITDIDEIFEKGLPIMELEIVDALLPDLEEEVMDVNLVQRMHKSGRKVNFRVIVAVGNKNGYVGLGQGKAREVGPAIRKAVDNAKYNIIKVRRGCGDWGCVCGREHTVPFKVTGNMGSVDVTLIPASAASITASAANAGGTKMILTLAPAFATASATVLNTGLPRCSVPPFPGVTPPTTLVPYSIIWLAWKVPSLPVNPCTITLESLFTNTDIFYCKLLIL